MSFRAFLRTIQLHNIKQAHNIVLGNTSADYDSFFGSILLAFLLTQSTNRLHMPIIDCPKPDLPLRFQICGVLDRLQISHNIFHFRESLSQKPHDSFVSLYDHNERTGLENIQYIVDHHAFNKLYGRKQLISQMGSALTLVYFLMNPLRIDQVQSQVGKHQFIEGFRQFIKGEPFEKGLSEIQPQIDEIIRYGIIIDSFNFDLKNADRWTIFDKKAVQFIQKQRKYELGAQWLDDLKFDNTRNKQITFQQSLNKDFKRFVYAENFMVDYSIIYLAPQDFYEHFIGQIQKFTTCQQQSNLYFFMAIFKKHSQHRPQRQIMFRIKESSNSTVKLIQEFLGQQKFQRMGSLGQWQWYRDPSGTQSRKKFDMNFRNFIKQSKPSL